MNFNVQIINHTVPALSVTSSSPTVTYEQIKNSLGQQNYSAQGLYMYSPNDKQLVTVLNYNRYDVNGNTEITNIVSTIDPYQFVGSVYMDLKSKSNTNIIFNGNSSISTTILPTTSLQMVFSTDKITPDINGVLPNNFSMIQDATNTTFFDGNCEAGIEDKRPVDIQNSGGGGMPTAEDVISKNWLWLAFVLTGSYLLTTAKK